MSKSKAIIVLAVLLQGCAQMPVSDSSSYAPGNNEQFVLAEKPEQLRQYGFDGFCESTESFACRNRLNYRRYVGMKGYFTTDEPTHTDFSGHQFWPVVLENGRQFFYVSNPKYGGKYGSSADIVPLTRYEQVASYSAEPLVPGSEITVEAVELSSGRERYSLSNGEKIGKEKLNYVRKLSAQFPSSQPEIARTLLDFRITFDEIENQYFIQPQGDILRNEAKLYIGVRPSKTWLRMKIKYYGDDWLFARSYKVAADDYRWESPALQFERDHSGGHVWEWIDKAPSEDDLQNMRALANATDPVIRFQGRQYYSDFKLSSQQQSSIAEVLGLFGLLRR